MPLPPPPPPPPTGSPITPPPPTGAPLAGAPQIARLVDGGDVMVEASGLTKTFGDVVAVSDVTFQIGRGITAILGPNGAGKSTLFRMLCGLTPPSKGTVTVLGRNARRDRDVRGRIGLAPQQDALFDRLSAHDFVTFTARTHGVSDAEAQARRALGFVDLDADDPKPVGSFSKGMRQRAKLAAAVVNDPDVLVLDEPLTGLDPVQRQRMIALFNELAAQDKCLLVSSHVLDEVARLGSNVLVVAHGRLIARGDYHDLRGLMDDRAHRIRIGVSDPRTLASALVERGLVTALNLEVGTRSDELVIDTADVDGLGRQIAPLARELGIRLTEMQPLDDDLESVFRYLVEGR